MLTWDDIYNASTGKSWHSRELRVQYIAEEQLMELILDELSLTLDDLCYANECEFKEDAIEIFLSQRKEPVYFDEHGIIIQK